MGPKGSTGMMARFRSAKWLPVAGAGWTIVAVFFVAYGVTSALNQSEHLRWGTQQTLTFAVLIAAPLAIAFVWPRLTGVKVLSIEITLASVERRVEKDLAPLVYEGRQAHNAPGFSDQIVDRISLAAEKQTRNPLVVNLGSCSAWTSTRLYFLAVLAERYTKIPCFVFAADRGDEKACFIGIASPADVRRQIGAERPDLEQKFWTAYERVRNRQHPKDLAEEIGAIRYRLCANFGGMLWHDKRKVLITGDILERWLGKELGGSPLIEYEGPETPLLRWKIVNQSTRFVAVLARDKDTDKQWGVDRVKVVDRLELAARTTTAMLERQIGQT